MIAYKGFNEDFKCRGFQYKVGETYEIKGRVICCAHGFHACTNPMDVWNYYPITDSRFSEVELSGEIDKDNNDSKLCGSKIKILKEISVEDYIRCCSNWMRKNTRSKYAWNQKEINDNCDSVIISSYKDQARIYSSGDNAKIASFGYNSEINSCGRSVQISSCGEYARIYSLGCNHQIVSSDSYARIFSCGSSVKIGSCGDDVIIDSTGCSSEIVSCGNNAQIRTSGNNAYVASYGNNATIICSGRFSKVKAKKGSSIILTEWVWDGHRGFIPMCIKIESVDGERIKENTWYKLRDGKFVETI